MTYKLVLLRHGQSEWNEKNLFTGWVDVNLTDKGRAEAKRGGELLAERNILPAASRHQHRKHRPGCSGPPVDSRQAHLAPERASLRRPAG